MNKHQKGFGAFGIIIIVLVVFFLVVIGLLVWQRLTGSGDSAETSTSETSKDSKVKIPSEDDVPSPTKDWATYSSPDGNFSFKHPKTWVFPESLEFCGEGLVLVAPFKDSLGRCGSEFGGQMQISSTKGDLRNDYKLKAENFDDLKEEPVTVDGVPGVRQSATVVSRPDDVEGLGSSPDGTKLVKYLFLEGGRTVEANYVGEPDFEDVLSDFELLVTKTLKFSK
jgi:hypothetical protein